MCLFKNDAKRTKRDEYDFEFDFNFCPFLESKEEQKLIPKS